MGSIHKCNILIFVRAVCTHQWPHHQSQQVNLSCRRVGLQSHVSWHERTFEKAKESIEAVISTKRKHTDIADTLIGSQRRKLLDLKVRKIIRQLSGEPTQQSIDYIQGSELSSSPFFHLVASLLCTPTLCPCTSSKVSDAPTLIITAGIICVLAKSHRLKSTRN